VDGRKALKQKITPEDFDSVYTFYADAEPADWFVKEIRYPFYDSDLGNALGDVEVELMDIVRMASKDWTNGKKVLIRCQAGLNRSGLVMGLVLIRAGYTGAEALQLMRSGRSEWCVCNKSFEQYLLTTNPDIWRN
jgi:protein-tyrosine phosphatase